MIVFGLSGVVNRALSFMLIPFYTNHIGPNQYGVLGLMMIIYSMIPVVLKMGLGNALLRSWYDYPDDERPVLATTVFTFLMATTIPLLALLFLATGKASVWLFESSDYTYHLRVICLLSFLEVFNVVPDALLRINSASVKYSLCQTVGFFCQLTTSLYLVVYANRGIQGVLLGNLAGAIVENSLMFALTVRQLRWGFNLKELRVMLNFGTPLIFGRLAASCFQWIDRFFIKEYANLKQVGLYTLGNQLTTPINLLITTPFSMIWPNMQFSTMQDKDAKEYYARMLTYVTFASTMLALPLAILIEDVLRIFASPKYGETATIVPWLAASAVLDIANPVLSVGVSLKRKSYLSPVIVVSSALINIGLNFLLIPSMGMKGAAIATFLSYIAMCIIRYQISNRLMPVEYEWGRLAKITVVSLLLYGLSRGIVIAHPIVSFMARLPLTLILPIILIPLGFYDTKEQQQVKLLIKELPQRVKLLLAMRG